MNCPNCHKVLYSRQRPCEHCGAPLPEELRLPEDEIAKLKQEREEFDARLAKMRKEAAEDEEERKTRWGSFIPPPSLPPPGA